MARRYIKYGPCYLACLTARNIAAFAEIEERDENERQEPRAPTLQELRRMTPFEEMDIIAYSAGPSRKGHRRP